INGKSRRCRLGHVISCVQSQLITWDIYTDHQGTDDQCALMICVASAVPPVSVHQCQLSVLIHATCQCPSELPFSATYQCCLTVPPISTMYEYCLSVPISEVCQCPSVPPTSASSSV
ncbi:unnamed protein product, partial [Staurois parvus]